MADNTSRRIPGLTEAMLYGEDFAEACREKARQEARADYDTLKERADALAESLVRAEWAGDLTQQQMEALAAYRGAGPNQLDDRAE